MPIPRHRSADAAQQAVRPQSPAVAAAGGLVGLAAGFALTFLISQLRPAFSDPRTLREVTGLPVLGTVSMLHTSARTRARRRGLLAFSSGLVAYAGAFVAATVALKFIQA